MQGSTAAAPACTWLSSCPTNTPVHRRLASHTHAPTAALTQGPQTPLRSSLTPFPWLATKIADVLAPCASTACRTVVEPIASLTDKCHTNRLETPGQAARRHVRSCVEGSSAPCMSEWVHPTWDGATLSWVCTHPAPHPPHTCSVRS